MKTTINVNGEPVEITLTAEQINKIKGSGKITDRVKTFSDACAIAGATPDVLTLLSTPTADRNLIASQGHAKLVIIARALNEGWKPDFTNTSQPKYYPWLQYSSASGFSYCGYVSTYASARVGSRLCFKSSELAKYAAEQFRDIYNEFLG